jgi:predicted transcriptional regulator
MSQILDPEEDLHVVQIKVRLRPADADLAKAIARKTRTPLAVVLRRMIVRELDRYGAYTSESLPADARNGRAH